MFEQLLVADTDTHVSLYSRFVLITSVAVESLGGLFLWKVLDAHINLWMA